MLVATWLQLKLYMVYMVDKGCCLKFCMVATWLQFKLYMVYMVDKGVA